MPPRYLITLLGVSLAIVLPLPHAGAAEVNAFIDDDNSRFEAYIETAVAAGLLEACNEAGDRFCPDDPLTSGQLDIALAQVVGSTVADREGSDGDDSACEPGEFCPHRPVTRAEFAAKVGLARGWSIPADVDPYLDVGRDSFGPSLAEMARRGAIAACDAPVGRRLCPRRTITKAEAAFSLVASFDLEPTPDDEQSLRLSAIAFLDGFDSLDPWDGRTPSARNRLSLTSDGFQESGLRVDIPAGSHFGADFRLDLGSRLGEDPEHLFFRYYLRFDPDWSAESSGKLPGFSGIYNRTGKGGFPSVPTLPGWSARLQFYPTADADTRARLGYYVYHLGQERSYGDGMPWNEAGSLVPGDWYCVEGEVALNTPGLTDGALRAWVDGSLAFDEAGLEFRRPDEPEIKVESFWFNVYYGGLTVPKSDLGLTIDEVAVDTVRVGCERAPIDTLRISGDFDGVGFVDQLGWDSCPGGPCFRLETRSLDDASVVTTSTSNLGGDSWLSVETDRLGFASGDLDGDGHDDLIYRGRCDASVPCWRVHRFDDLHRGVGENWGDNAWFSDASTAVVAGDWTGDGLADVAYQGICGSDQHDCWRVHPSAGDHLSSPRDWGKSPTDAVDPHSADLTGDGREDLVYAAPCGEETCWWIQPSRGRWFGTATILGTAAPHEVDRGHFVDFDDDGLADLVTPAGDVIEVRVNDAGRLARAVVVAEFAHDVKELQWGHPVAAERLEAVAVLACPDGERTEHRIVRSGRLLNVERYRDQILILLDHHLVI